MDTAGAFGIARTLMYKGEEKEEPLYSLLPDGTVLQGLEDAPPSFFEEYHRKLEGIYTRFYTPRGEEIAYSRKSAAGAFYRALLAEARASRGVWDARFWEKGLYAVRLMRCSVKL